MVFTERGWIKPTDSEWLSPYLSVRKKEKGEWRLAVNYQALNEQRDHGLY